jgi:hypothetical protein
LRHRDKKNLAYRASLSLILLLGSAELCSATPSRAAVYAVVRSETDVVTVMDPAAVELVPGKSDLRRAWSVSVQRNLVSGGPQQAGYVRTLNEYDCAAHKIRWKSFFVYSRFGASVMHKDNDDETWNAITAGGEPEASARIVCDHNNRWSAIASQSLSQLVITLMQAWDDATPMPPLQPVKMKDPPKASSKRKATTPKDKSAAQQ